MRVRHSQAYHARMKRKRHAQQWKKINRRLDAFGAAFRKRVAESEAKHAG